MTLIWAIYFGIAELLSLGQTSRSSPCVWISQAQQAEDNSGYQSCATLHEASFRFLNFIWEHTNHENVVAFGTMVVAIFTYTLYKSTNKLWDVATRQAGENEKALQITQRAYIAVEPMGLRPYGADGQVIAHYKVRNAGRLPAKNIRWFAYVRMDDNKEANHFPIDESDLYGDNVLAAGATMTHGTDRLPMKAQHIYVWGIIRYDDGFGKERFTKFCHRYNTDAREILPSGQATVTQATVREFVPAHTGRHHGYGNSTDESERPDFPST
jgi:hypothetical protein